MIRRTLKITYIHKLWKSLPIICKEEYWAFLPSQGDMDFSKLLAWRNDKPFTKWVKTDKTTAWRDHGN